ncbi:universal stress protein [Microbacterium invictum]|uniref:Universal stress protein n=1 Tax=Microbacterium invictum TaxID=515415 RepID=A0ABZ0VGP9_9MICO|nr:universal stress protein [Microbacterium invictum]WQB71370.1 universal stress protein [Microbacterium invictum]
MTGAPGDSPGMGPMLVGYTATDAGDDAATLGARLAAAAGTDLELAVVLPSDDRSVITPPDAGYDQYLRQQAETWLGRAEERVREAFHGHSRRAGEAHRQVRYDESFAAGLVAAGHETGASHIVVGAGGGGLRGRHRLGSVASELLHSSDLPVVLAPEGARRTDPGSGISRITAAVGTRPGAEALLEHAVALAAATGAELRLLSLVTVDLPPSVDTGVIRLAGAAHAEEVLEAARHALPQGIDAEAIVGTGDSIEDAVSHIGWEPGEIALVGSSRLAQPRRLFLGSTAAKMLHELPVPMIVVPRSHARQPQEGERR